MLTIAVCISFASLGIIVGLAFLTHEVSNLNFTLERIAKSNERR